jgi:hypothetical protein
MDVPSVTCELDRDEDWEHLKRDHLLKHQEK